MKFISIFISLSIVASVSACPSWSGSDGSRSARLSSSPSSLSNNPVIYVINHYFRGDDALGEDGAASNSQAIVSKYSKLTSSGGEVSSFEEASGVLDGRPAAPAPGSNAGTQASRRPIQERTVVGSGEVTTAPTTTQAPKLNTIRVNRPIKVYAYVDWYWEKTTSYNNNVTYPGGLCVPGHPRHTACHVYCTDANNVNRGLCTAAKCDYVDGACHVRCDRPFDHHEIGCRVACENGVDETGKCADFKEWNEEDYYG